MRREMKQLVLLLCLPYWLAAPLQGAGAAAMPLRTSVAVGSNQVLLSDLLPRTAPDKIRSLAASIDLGRAPRPGYQRIITAEFIGHRLSSVPVLESLFRIPRQVVVFRAHRNLEPEEVAASLHSALEHSGCNSLRGLDLRDVELTAPVAVTSTAPVVDVGRVEADPFLSHLRFRLFLRNEEPSLPFYAVLRLPPGISAGEVKAKRDCMMQSLSAGKTDLESSRPAQRRKRERKPVLVRAGRQATLRSETPGFRMQLPVIPLQHGTRGQKIRVRNPATRRIFVGIVVGTDLVRQEF